MVKLEYPKWALSQNEGNSVREERTKSEEKNMTWADLERSAKNQLLRLMVSGLEGDRVQLDACIFILSQDVPGLKGQEEYERELSNTAEEE